MKTLEQIAKEMKEIFPDGRINETGELSPFLQEPYSQLSPGGNRSLADNFREVFPEAFVEGSEVGFMGGENNSSDVEEIIFGSLTNQLIFQSEGTLDEGGFKAPISVFRSRWPYNQQRIYYILFQLGNYQIIPREQRRLVRNGKIRIFKGIKEKERFGYISCPDDLRTDLKEKVLEIVAAQFLYPALNFSMNKDNCKDNTSHIKKELREEFFKGILNEVSEEDRIHIFRYLYSHGLSFTTRRNTASIKFGPNYVSTITPLDNLRILTQWTGEYEVKLIDSSRTGSWRYHLK